jgi:hypothetical protein
LNEARRKTSEMPRTILWSLIKDQPPEQKMPKDAKATPPNNRNLVAFTGSETDPVRIKIVIPAEPIAKNLLSDLSAALFNISRILLSARLLITHKLA